MTTVVITGASRGIGLAAAIRFMVGGARVIATSRDEAGLQRIAGVDRRLHPVELDVRSDASVRAFADRVRELCPHVDVLLCTAGITIDAGTVPEQTVDDWNAVLDVNLTGTFRVIKALWPMLGSASRVLTVSGGRGGVAHRVSKSGLAALTMAVARDGADAGILACGYDPDAPKTPAACGVELVKLADRMASEKLTGVLSRAGEIVPW